MLSLTFLQYSAQFFQANWWKMDHLRVLFLGTVLLFVHTSVDASTIREMFIEEQSPADDSGEDAKTEHAHVPEEDDSRSSDLTEFDLQPADFSFDDAPSEDDKQESDNDLNENEVGMSICLVVYACCLFPDKEFVRLSHFRVIKMVKVNNYQEMVQSEPNSHTKNRGGKTLN